MSNDQTKHWYASKTMIAGVVTLVVGLGLLGDTITQEDQVAITELLTALAVSVSGLATLYGRKRAEKRIK